MPPETRELRSLILAAIARFEASLRLDTAAWRELVTLDTYGDVLATINRRMELAETLQHDPRYRARAKLIEALLTLDVPPPIPEPAEHHAETLDVVPADVVPQAIVPMPVTASPAAAAADDAQHTPADDRPFDDFTRIRAIAPPCAAALRAAGVRTFYDIATWNADDVAAMTERLGCGRRIHRENWIEQAALLAMTDADAHPVAATTMSAATVSIPAAVTLSPEAPPTVEGGDLTTDPAPAVLAIRDVVIAAVDNPIASEPPHVEPPPVITDTPATTLDADRDGDTDIEPPIQASDDADNGPTASTPPSQSPIPVEESHDDAHADETSDESADDAEALYAADDDDAIVVKCSRTPAATTEALEQRIVGAGPRPAPPARASEPLPPTGFTRLLEQRAAARLRRAAETDARLSSAPDDDMADNDVPDDIPEADVTVIVRRPAALPRAVNLDPPPRRSAPAAPEASVEIVNPRRQPPPEHAIDGLSSPPPAAQSLPQSRFFRALKGE